LFIHCHQGEIDCFALFCFCHEILSGVKCGFRGKFSEKTD
jgi:hypothetical protein